MKILDCGPLVVCAACLQLIANDEATDEHRTKFADWQDEYGDGGVLVIDEEEHTFSSSRCDGCGTTLAGHRHEVFCLVPEEAS